MTVKIAVNGLGRIGRCVLRAWAMGVRDDVEIVAINASGDISKHVHLLKYDSTHGVFAGDVSGGDDYLEMAGRRMVRFDSRDPSAVDWAGVGADIVLECTGVFKSRDKASLYLQGGAKKVLISAPAKDPDRTVVYGVNHEEIAGDDKIISVGSCTTNCLAPVAKVLDAEFGIVSGFMTTVHAYTNDQNVLDGSHNDLQRARSCGMSMIPTSTGAAKALGEVLPSLAGKLDGVAVRVPTPNVSMVDLTAVLGRDVSAQDITSAMESAASGAMSGVLAVNHDPLVSVDYNGRGESSIYDARSTHVVGGNLARIAAWYDNEWGFSLRMLDVAAYVGGVK